jgi:hypothetical protein
MRAGAPLGCRALVAGVALAVAAAAPARAQVLASAVQGIAFAAMLPGVPKPVSRTDGAAGGRFNLQGPKDTQVLLQFSLPTSMSGPGGATLPVTFGSGDAGYSPQQNINNQTGFDPRTPQMVEISSSGRGSVFLGATARPGPAQQPGAYTGTLILTVTVIP